MKRSWEGWTPESVSSLDPARANIRSYIERRQLRRVLEQIGSIDPAVEVGAGYGRMTVVLLEHARTVVAMEREWELRDRGILIVPDAVWRELPDITKLPAEDDAFAFAMTFTVLQHVTDEVAELAIAELRRIVWPGGHFLMVEDTNAGRRYVDPTDASHISFGRSVAWYEAAAAPARLVSKTPRWVEPGYHQDGRLRKYVGHYLLFEVPP
ncbi:MAG: methyltransferase domain-containing protein [Myxococcota bacterium]